jgi:inorganic pyrophosphatase
MLPDGMSFPVDFGFVPSTLCDDGEPLNVMVLCEAPSPVGTSVQIRPISVPEAEQTENGGRSATTVCSPFR